MIARANAGRREGPRHPFSSGRLISIVCFRGLRAAWSLALTPAGVVGGLAFVQYRRSRRPAEHARPPFRTMPHPLVPVAAPHSHTVLLGRSKSPFLCPCFPYCAALRRYCALREPAALLPPHPSQSGRPPPRRRSSCASLHCSGSRSTIAARRGARLWEGPSSRALCFVVGFFPPVFLSRCLPSLFLLDSCSPSHCRCLQLPGASPLAFRPLLLPCRTRTPRSPLPDAALAARGRRD